jgi:hypothetical protein
MMGIFLYFSRVYFKKGYKKTSLSFFLVFSLSLAALVFFLLHGGPEKAPKEFVKMVEKLF